MGLVSGKSSATLRDPKSSTEVLIRKVWEHNLPLLQSRLDLLDCAGRAAALGGLNEAMQIEAARTAHNLAGSLGMFGFADGTAIARELEAALSTEVEVAVEPGLICELADQLRRTLSL